MRRSPGEGNTAADIGRRGWMCNSWAYDKLRGEKRRWEHSRRLRQLFHRQVAAMAGEAHGAALEDEQFTRKEFLPAARAQRLRGDDNAEVDMVAAELHAQIGVFEAAFFLIANKHVAIVQALPARAVVIAEKSLPVRKEHVQRAGAIVLGQLLVQPRPVLRVGERFFPCADLIEQVAEEMLGIGGADRMEATQAQVIGVFQGAVVREAILPSAEFAG